VDGLTVLIPVLSRKEDNEEFLKEATAKAKEILLLLVIDTKSSPSSGFTASEIAQGQKIMDSVRERVGKMRKSCEELLEWGDTMTRIDHTAKLRRVDSIVLLREENQFFEELVEFLKKQKAYKVRVIKARETVRAEEE